MKMGFTMLKILIVLLIASSAAAAQDNKTGQEFRPAAIIHGIDKPEGMAVIGNDLYISRYHENGGIFKYDIANKLVTGSVTDGLNYPSGLLAFNDQLIVLEYGSGSLYLVDPNNGRKELMTAGFSRPADVILFNDNLLVSDFGTGTIYEVSTASFEKSVFAAGLSTPAGLAVFKDQVHVVEWGMGRISKISKDGTREPLVSEGLSSPWGLMVYEDELYVAETGSNEISRIFPVKIAVEDHTGGHPADQSRSFRDSITVWKAASMNCSGLDHPEAFCVSERGIYISEWKSKEVSELRLNSPPTGELALNGKSKLGQVLEAEPKNIQDEDGLGPFSYRWQISNAPESEAWEYIDGRRVDYKLKKERLAGMFIRAELSYTDQGGFEEFVYSDARLVTRPYAPEVALSFYPENIALPGDTVTLIAKITVLDADAAQDKVEFFCNGQPLIRVDDAPYSYRFVIADNKASEGFIDHLSIVARGFDSNGLSGEDERTLYVTNEQYWEKELLSLLDAPGREVSIFPNPATDILNIVHKGNASVQVRLIGLNKQVVLSTEILNGIKKLNISKLIPGTYILEYTVGSETKAAKFIKL